MMQIFVQVEKKVKVKPKDKHCTNKHEVKRRDNESTKRRHKHKNVGAHENPSLNWKDEDEHVKNKMITSIKKIMRTEMKRHRAHMHFNTCTLTNVCFERGIVKFNKNHRKELK